MQTQKQFKKQNSWTIKKKKKIDNRKANVESMFALTISGQIKETRLTFSQGNVTVL